MCQHLNITASLQTFQVTSEQNPDMILERIIEASFVCADCGVPFIFEWSEIADPDRPPSFMAKRPWTTPNRDTLCAKIKEAGRQSPEGWAAEIPEGTKPN